MKDLSNKNVVHIKKGNVQYLQFRKLLEYKDIINHAYSLGTDVNFRTATKGKPIEDCTLAVNSYRRICEAIGTNYIRTVKPRQNHTNNVQIVTNKVNGEEPDFNLDIYKNTDGLITSKRNFILSTTNADCILLLLFDPIKKVIANVHSGWKGTLKRIGIIAINKMIAEFECKPEDIICCICPSIRKCHFEVGEDVKKEFEIEFADIIGNKYIENNNIRTIQLKDIIEEKIKNTKWNIDTVLINKILMQNIGLKPENIIDSGICTVCNCDLIHSYRSEKAEYGLETALIELK